MGEERRHQHNIIAIAAAFFFIFFGFGTAQQYLVVLFTNSGRGNLALLSLFLLYGAFLLTGIAVAKIIPFLGGLKNSLIFGAISYAVFVIGLALNNITVLVITSLLIGMGASLLWVSSGAIITDSSKEGEVGKNLAKQTVGNYLGNILGINLGAFLVSRLTPQWFFVLLGLTVAIGVIILFAVAPTKEEVKERPFKPMFLFDKRMLSLFPIIFGAYVLQAQVFTSMNIIVESLLGIGYIALIVSAVKVANIVGSFGSGALSGRMAKYTLLIALAIVALIGVIIFYGWHTLTSLIIGAILLGVSMSAIYPVSLAWLKERIPPTDYIYALGVFHVYTNIGVVSTIVANRILHSDKSYYVAVLALLLSIPGIWVFERSTIK